MASPFCLEKHSPRGSQHHVELVVSHTLAQNCLIEFWWGMHLTCRNTPVTPDRSGSVKRPEKLRHVPCEQIEKKRILKLKFGLKFVENRHAGSGLSRLPYTAKWKIAGTWSWSDSISPRADSVFVGQWLSVVHCPPASTRNMSKTKNSNQQAWTMNKKRRNRSFASLQMFHTHTHTHCNQRNHGIRRKTI